VRHGSLKAEVDDVVGPKGKHILTGPRRDTATRPVRSRSAAGGCRSVGRRHGRSMTSTKSSWERTRISKRETSSAMSCSSGRPPRGRARDRERAAHRPDQVLARARRDARDTADFGVVDPHYARIGEPVGGEIDGVICAWRCGCSTGWSSGLLLRHRAGHSIGGVKRPLGRWDGSTEPRGVNSAPVMRQ
jgi:hypothetical protein